MLKPGSKMIFRPVSSRTLFSSSRSYFDAPPDLLTYSEIYMYDSQSTGMYIYIYFVALPSSATREECVTFDAPEPVDGYVEEELETNTDRGVLSIG